MQVIIHDNQPAFCTGLITILLSHYTKWSIREADHPSIFPTNKEDNVVDLFILRAEYLQQYSASSSAVRTTRPNPKIIAITEENSAVTIAGCRVLGADTTLLRSAASATIISTVGSIISTAGSMLSPGQCDRDPTQSAFLAGAQGASIFSPRQLEVLHLLDKGQSNKLIARNLGLSLSTVKVHLGAVYRALGAQSRIEAVVLGRTL